MHFELAGVLASSFFANTVGEHYRKRENEKENSGADSNYNLKNESFKKRTQIGLANLIFFEQAPDTLLVVVVVRR